MKIDRESEYDGGCVEGGYTYTEGRARLAEYKWHLVGLAFEIWANPADCAATVREAIRVCRAAGALEASLIRCGVPAPHAAESPAGDEERPPCRR